MRPLLLALVLLPVGCSEGFDRYSELSSLRVLGMRSEPASPRPAVNANLQALVYAPAGQDVSYRWSFCPVAAKARDNYACPISPEAAAGAFGAGLPAFDLGNAPEAILIHSLAPEGLAALCAKGIATTGYAGSVDCDLGFPVTVVLDVSGGGEFLRAAFLVYLPIREDSSADNRNPSILELTANGVPMGDAVTATAGEPTTVTAAVAADAAESRPAFSFESGTAWRSERLTFSWFADHGSWKKDRTSFIDGETSLADAMSNPWTAPDVLPDMTTFAVVVRDDRGGVGWLERRALLGGRP